MTVQQPAMAQSSAVADVVVNINGMRNAKGQLMICLTKNAKAFPDCTKDGSALKKLVSASTPTGIRFTGVGLGTYAVSIVHDENTNNKLDTRVWIPKEGFGFSRNPKIGMGPPKFSSASFIVGELGTTLSVKMKYIF
jgi:uncharacterized protein (DUF2141 family)